MKNFIIVLIAFGVVGCGYEDKNECMLKEQQKCDGGCFAEAQQYCETKHPTPIQQAKSKELRKDYRSYKDCVNSLLDESSTVYRVSQVKNECRRAFL